MSLIRVYRAETHDPEYVNPDEIERVELVLRNSAMQRLPESCPIAYVIHLKSGQNTGKLCPKSLELLDKMFQPAWEVAAGEHEPMKDTLANASARFHRVPVEPGPFGPPGRRGG